MCRAMDTDPEIHEVLPETRLRKHLAPTVRKMNWSYAIFWSTSTRQPGVVVWSDGYYNGGIKTRKITQPMELKADQMGLRRSKQLRELYESLSAGENSQQTRRPSASLSPEDLTDTEWYYLVCMTFSFTLGQGLPGKALANNQHIWLNNAQFADCNTFSRSLVAKSASIQTVVCIPFEVGVLELGTTKSIMEDPTLINQITNSFWEIRNPAFSEQSLSSLQVVENDETKLDDEVDDSMSLEDHKLVTDCQTPLLSGSAHSLFHLPSYASTQQTESIQDRVEELHTNTGEEPNISSPEENSNVCCLTQQLEDLLGTDGLSSRHPVNDSFSNGLHDPLNSDEYVSLSLINAQRVVSSAKWEKISNQMLHDLEDGNHNNLTSLDLHFDDVHYAKTVSTILQNSTELKPVLCFLKVSDKSSFTLWKRGSDCPVSFTSTPHQKLLKKILMEKGWVSSNSSLKHGEQNNLHEKVWESEGETGAKGAAITEKKREKLNKKFHVMRSLIPYVSKVDKGSILGDTADYLKHLERRVLELESCLGSANINNNTPDRKKHPDVAERTSDNYVNKQMMNDRKPVANKRKATDIEESEAERRCIQSKEDTADVNVSVKEEEVLVQMHCPWREYLLLEIVESISNHFLDPLSVQSSTDDGLLSLTVKSKIRSSTATSPGMIKRSLQRVISKCL